jgi:hypothetical protein
MKPDDVLIKVPWESVIKLIVMLVKFSKGGITKEESKILISALLDLVAELTTGAVAVAPK